jgi:hypothetical protein
MGIVSAEMSMSLDGFAAEPGRQGGNDRRPRPAMRPGKPPIPPAPADADSKTSCLAAA